MSELAQVLTPHEYWALAWRLVAWVCIVYLFGLGGLIFVRPAIANRFLEGFVTSRRVNLLEAALRLFAGLAFIAVSPETKLPAPLFCFGAVLAVSAIFMVFHYDSHKRYAEWAIPFAKRILPAMGIAAIALGAIVAWALT